MSPFDISNNISSNNSLSNASVNYYVHNPISNAISQKDSDLTIQLNQLEKNLNEAEKKYGKLENQEKTYSIFEAPREKLIELTTFLSNKMASIPAFFYTENSEKLPSNSQLHKIPQSRLYEKKIVDDGDVRTKRAASFVNPSNMEKCIEILQNIRNGIPVTEAQLEGLICNFSDKNSEANKLAKNIYTDLQNSFSGSIQDKQLDNFETLNQMVFQSLRRTDSNLVSAYLSAFNKLIERFWDSRYEPSVEKKIKLKTIIDKYFNYKVIKRIEENEYEPTHNLLQSSMMFVFLDSTRLYIEEKEYNGFLSNYLNYCKHVLHTVPEHNKILIREMLAQYFTNFLIIKNPLYTERQDCLKTKLVSNGNSLRLTINGEPFYWSVTKPTT
ncbi:hypothetical protein, partial [Clostridium chrysemydis]|uniref:hypothetical protein n=1 Tax=Clostridium chrysemydis TaxID=2665504 RepID=UPI003F3F6BBD